jgi:NADH:ubiquinone oxidoreductase subunit C
MSTQPVQKQQELPKEEKVIVDTIAKSLGEKVKIGYARPNRIRFLVQRENIIEAARLLRDSLHFDHCTNVTGTDFPKDNQIQLDYHFGSIDGEGLRRIIVTLSCRLGYDDLRVPSLVNEFPSAEFHEREAYEMLGITFEGHPNLSRLLLPEDWDDIPPMLKKYRLPGRLEGE